MNILLTSAGRRGYLVDYFKDALKKTGVGGTVHVANSTEAPAFSHGDKTCITPLIYDQDYIPFLLSYCQRERISLLVPLFDLDIPVLAEHREAFTRIGTVVPVPDADQANMCNDKWETYRALTKAGFSMPLTWLTVADATAAIKRGLVRWPLIIKPRWGMGSLSIYQADNELELTVLTDKIRREIKTSYLNYETMADEDHPVIIQQKICGTEYGLDVFHDLKGTYQNCVVKEKLAMRAGETDAAITLEHEDLNALGQKLGIYLGHRGNLDVDVFCQDGKYYILELNARFGGGYPFSHIAGADLPQALVRWTLGHKVEPQLLAARPGIRAQKDIQVIIYG